ncbi:hypothetical protein KIN20_017075 [Parelaphostrongylus tenuis]|uniref:Uncharacterized protein n=2 Tax=Parelaphostrongylus tenuis TaxID=148309 RepID=A0AAD5QNE6_PARTN|nr:hypothetical protein KIN20_017075 [Parelaphostrongylus tenuis]
MNRRISDLVASCFSLLLLVAPNAKAELRQFSNNFARRLQNRRQSTVICYIIVSLLSEVHRLQKLSGAPRAERSIEIEDGKVCILSIVYALLPSIPRLNTEQCFMIRKLCSIMSIMPSTQYNHQLVCLLLEISKYVIVKSVEIGTIDAVLQILADHIERDPQRTDVSAMIWFLGLGSRLEVCQRIFRRLGELLTAQSRPPVALLMPQLPAQFPRANSQISLQAAVVQADGRKTTASRSLPYNSSSDDGVTFSIQVYHSCVKPLQDNNLDIADRIFNSIEDAWSLSSSESTTDFKISSMSFSPKNCLIVLGCDSGTIITYQVDFDDKSVKSVKERLHLLGHSHPITAIGVCDEFSVLVSADSSGKVIVWDCTKLIFIRVLRQSCSSAIRSVCISQTTADIAIAIDVEGGSIVEFYTVNGDLINKIDVDKRVLCMTMSNQSEGTAINCLALGLLSGEIRLIETWKLSIIRTIRHPAYTDPVISIDYSPSARKLFASQANLGAKSRSDLVSTQVLAWQYGFYQTKQQNVNFIPLDDSF